MELEIPPWALVASASALGVLAYAFVGGLAAAVAARLEGITAEDIDEGRAGGMAGIALFWPLLALFVPVMVAFLTPPLPGPQAQAVAAARHTRPPNTPEGRPVLPDSPVTVTLDPELLAYALPALAALSYPMWGAVTAGLWGRRYGYTKPLDRGEQGNLALCGALWPVFLPLLVVNTIVSGVYAPVTRAFLKDANPKD